MSNQIQNQRVEMIRTIIAFQKAAAGLPQNHGGRFWKSVADEAARKLFELDERVAKGQVRRG